MKILYILSFEENSGGGEGQISYELAENMAKRQQVSIISPGKTNKIQEASTGYTKCTVKSTMGPDSFYYIPVFSKHNLDFILEFIDNFSPDIIHSQTPVGIGLVAQIWAINNNIPFIYTAHILPTKALSFGIPLDTKRFEFVYDMFNKWVTDKYLENFYRHCTNVIALNQTALHDIQEFGYTGETAIIPNGRNLDLYDGCRISDMAAKEKQLVFIGNLNVRKNQAYLIEVTNLLPKNYKLHLVGKPYTKAFEKKLQTFVDDDHKENVIFHGGVKHEQIPGILEQSHLFVSASKTEVQSLVIIESLASGTPIVGLSNETVDEFVDENVGFRFPKDASPKEFAQKIEEICNLDQESYNRLCATAKERVQHLDWPNVIDQIENLYFKYLGKTVPYDQKDAQSFTEGLINLIPSKRIQENLKKSLEDLGIASTSKKEIGISKAMQKVPQNTKHMLLITALISLVIFGAWKLTTIGKNKKTSRASNK
ncbi:glycosyltransferase [Candidatus Dojkabacteria bacterium]|nr:glycosyltransferase [Candidatus Dojkabacteria bacterium]